MFTDKESGVLYMLDSPFVSNDYKRVKELEKLGYIIANEDVESLKVAEKQPTPNKKKATTRKKASDSNGRDSTKG